MDRPRLLVDCDPGIDDAFALLCALTYGNLTAVTTVSGNVPVENTTRNARWILELAGAGHVPVHPGSSEPLKVAPAFASEIHGRSGLGAFETPEPTTPASSTGALEAITHHCEPGDAIIIAIGPLTNIARALIDDPSLAQRIGHLHWMGGSATAGNTTAHAEFNAWADPHAVAVVLQSGCAMSMYGLDLTYQVRLNEVAIASLREAGTATSTHLADFLSHYRSTASSAQEGQPIHDACAVLGATHHDLFTRTPSHIVIEAESVDKRGKTTVSEAPEAPHNHVHTAAADSVRPLILRAAINPEPLR